MTRVPGSVFSLQDREILAAGRDEGLTLVTRDARIPLYDVTTMPA